MPAFSKSTSTTDHALKVVSEWEKSEKVKYAVAHTGVNDVTNGTSAHVIIKNLKKLLTIMSEIFPQAVIAYSEILFIGRGDRDSNYNVAVKKINEALFSFCNEYDFIYVSHDSLQKASCTLYADHGKDPKHLDDRGGTAVFVSDILNATGYRRQQQQRRTNNNRAGGGSSGPAGTVLTVYNRNKDQDKRSRQDRRMRIDEAPLTTGSNLENISNDQLFKLVCLRMLR